MTMKCVLDCVCKHIVVLYLYMENIYSKQCSRIYFRYSFIKIQLIINIVYCQQCASNLHNIQLTYLLTQWQTGLSERRFGHPLKYLQKYSTFYTFKVQGEYSTFYIFKVRGNTVPSIHLRCRVNTVPSIFSKDHVIWPHTAEKSVSV